MKTSNHIIKGKVRRFSEPVTRSQAKHLTKVLDLFYTDFLQELEIVNEFGTIHVPKATSFVAHQIEIGHQQDEIDLLDGQQAGDIVYAA